jgi:hypothetical protein
MRETFRDTDGRVRAIADRLYDVYTALGESQRADETVTRFGAQ